MAFLRCTVFVFCVTAVSFTFGQTETQKATLETYIKNKESEINQRYRLHYHVMPPVGWMNDPNGFSYYKNEYHLFYQFYPYDSKWGPMHWGHSSSPDLVNWKTLPTALIPGEEQCFSGSGVVEGDNLVLMYTGHVIVDNSTQPTVVNETQYLAYSSDGSNFVKYENNPVIPFAPNLSPDFRDPKVWKHGDHWYVILGSTYMTNNTYNRTGRVLFYRSTDLKEWDYLSAIDSLDGIDLSYMWECPDFFELDGKFVLLMSPQGMLAEGDRYKNLFQTGYVIGNFSYETFEFTQEVGFKEIDFGHDFYATQTIESNSSRFMVAWFGMWEVDHPEAVDGWTGAMTIIRELKIHNDTILMKPVESMSTLRDATVFTGNFTSAQSLEFDTTGEIILSGNLSENIELALQGKNGGGQAWIIWDASTGMVVVDRGNGDIRQVEWVPINSTIWRLFLDTSSLELFCGEGEVVFSSRVYPNGPWKITNLSRQTLEVTAYHLKRSVPYYVSSTNKLNSVVAVYLALTLMFSKFLCFSINE